MLAVLLAELGAARSRTMQIRWPAETLAERTPRGDNTDDRSLPEEETAPCQDLEHESWPVTQRIQGLDGLGVLK